MKRTSAASLLAQFCVPPKQWVGDLTKLRPEHSQTWNTVVLTKDDLDESFVALMEKLFCVYEEGKLDKLCFAKLDLYYSLPCTDGRAYDLIPSGSHISVTADNAWDYFHRLRYEYAKLRDLLKLSPPISVSEGGDGALPAYACVVCGANDGDGAVNVQQTCSHVDGHEVSGNDPYTRFVNADDTNGAKGDVLTEADLSFLDDFYDNAKAMLKSLDIDKAELPCHNLRWCIIIPNRNLSIPLRSHGDSIVVSPNAFHEYLESALQVIEEIRRIIAAHGHYPAPLGDRLQPNVNCTAQTDSVPLRDQAEILRSTHLREVAIPRQLTTAEAALYSPTHNFTGLFAPPQHLNL